MDEDYKLDDLALKREVERLVCDLAAEKYADAVAGVRGGYQLQVWDLLVM